MDTNLGYVLRSHCILKPLYILWLMSVWVDPVNSFLRVSCPGAQGVKNIIWKHDENMKTVKKIKDLMQNESQT